MPKHLYHLTKVENLAAVLATGLKADLEGAIYAFTDLIVANTIACNQVFVRRYAVFEIAHGGVTGGVEPDNVGEFSASFQRRIMQATIGPQHLSNVGTFDAITDQPTAWDYAIGQKLYRRSPEEVREVFTALRELAGKTEDSTR